MGIGITSNCALAHMCPVFVRVSIPNGDRHYLERTKLCSSVKPVLVSIPNGDRHYLERGLSGLEIMDLSVSIPNGDRHYLEHWAKSPIRGGNEFQSPMGIGITSN